MVHAFLLVLLLGDVEQRNNPMYFRDINSCNYFASQVVKRYGNYGYHSLVPQKHKATAYCKPVYIDDDTVGLYD
tara:strand:+ start:1308 stop:1529 length:222 start_codon:yes stop_codon:yes gene_type:complete